MIRPALEASALIAACGRSMAPPSSRCSCSSMAWRISAESTLRKTWRFSRSSPNLWRAYASRSARARASDGLQMDSKSGKAPSHRRAASSVFSASTRMRPRRSSLASKRAAAARQSASVVSGATSSTERERSAMTSECRVRLSGASASRCCAATKYAKSAPSAGSLVSAAATSMRSASRRESRRTAASSSGVASSSSMAILSHFV
mmetsp:Transcript_23172/g.78291  ORF Transcript_23172/g.78291 Transcript_23172/m.78291 type:complete len:205 (+) Transcript_23172:398-1012(+)